MSSRSHNALVADRLILAACWHAVKRLDTAHCKGLMDQSVHKRNWTGMFRALQRSTASTYVGPPSSAPDAHCSPQFRASHRRRTSSAGITAGQPHAAATTASTAPWASAGHCGRAPHRFVRVRFLSACKARNAGGDLRTRGPRFSGVRDEAWDFECILMAQAGDFGGLAKRDWSGMSGLGKAIASACAPAKNGIRVEPWQRRRDSVRPKQRDCRALLDLQKQTLR